MAIAVIPIDDAETESSETVICSALPGAGYRVSASASIMLRDNEPEEFTISKVQDASEAGVNGIFAITRTGSVAVARTITYTVAGTATSGTDYTALSGTLTMSANANSATLSLAPRSDSLVEPGETVRVTLTSAGLTYANATADLTIFDDDDPTLPQLSLVAGDAVVAEPVDHGSFVLSRTGSTAAALTIGFLPVTGTAAAGSDFQPLPSEVVLEPGQASISLPLLVIDDGIAEAAKTVGLALAARPDYRLGSKRAVALTIADDDLPAVSIAASDNRGTEPGTDTGRFTFTRLGDLTNALTVAVISGGTAQQNVDVVALPISVTFAAKTSTATVTVTPLDDQLAEPDETVVLRTMPGSGYCLAGDSVAVVTISDNDFPVVEITAIDPQANESGDRATLRVLRTGKRSAALTVPLLWSGTVGNGTDVNALPATVTIAANSGSTDLTIVPRQDSVSEPIETLTATLGAGTGFALGGRSHATVELGDDEAATVTISPASQSADEWDSSWVAFVVNRVGRTSTPLTIGYNISGTAQVLELFARQLVLPAGVDQARILLVPEADERVEGVETVIIRLLPGAGYGLGTGIEAVLSIIEVVPAGG